MKKTLHKVRRLFHVTERNLHRRIWKNPGLLLWQESAYRDHTWTFCRHPPYCTNLFLCKECFHPPTACYINSNCRIVRFFCETAWNLPPTSFLIIIHHAQRESYFFFAFEHRVQKQQQWDKQRQIRFVHDGGSGADWEEALNPFSFVIIL